ncbi:MAG: tyrosine-type recombinase/integrase [Clostridia bacterium]|nr:tyrosine-type recombinase/integrase [Clostridia bacterium]
MTLKSADFKALPQFLKDYAGYTATIKGNSEKTVCEYLLDLRTFFRFLKMRELGEDWDEKEFESVSISDVTLEEANKVTSQNILDFLYYLGMERKNTPTTRMRKLSSLKSFFHYAYGKRHLIDSNPTSDIDAPKKNVTVPKYLTLEEAVRLLNSVTEDKESKTRQRDYTIIALFLNTGMRLSELVGLNLQSFDPELRSVKVLGKGNKERIIYLNEAARAAVEAYLRIRLDPKYVRTSSNAFLLSRLETRISPKTVQWVVYKYLDRTGLKSKGMSVHKLRHTAATLMYQSGKVDIRVLKDILGHEQLNTTQIYTHVVNRNLEEAMENNPLSDVFISNSKGTKK